MVTPKSVPFDERQIETIDQQLPEGQRTLETPFIFDDLQESLHTYQTIQRSDHFAFY